ncbi:Putative enoyl-CoA hydratase/isomerase [Mycobacteroides abscessus subsp. massiliense]|nr:Putative enoyl-CoA hydratase/isomerase [Mycobacteroides abscessus subsp. massiliense]
MHSGWIAEEDARAIEARLTRQVISSADAREGLSAFREKREARFTGQ